MDMKHTKQGISPFWALLGVLGVEEVVQCMVALWDIQQHNPTAQVMIAKNVSRHCQGCPRGQNWKHDVASFVLSQHGFSYWGSFMLPYKF